MLGGVAHGRLECETAQQQLDVTAYEPHGGHSGQNVPHEFKISLQDAFQSISKLIIDSMHCAA